MDQLQKKSYEDIELAWVSKYENIKILDFINLFYDFDVGI